MLVELFLPTFPSFHSHPPGTSVLELTRGSVEWTGRSSSSPVGRSYQHCNFIHLTAPHGRNSPRIVRPLPVQCRTTDIVQWKHGKFLSGRHTCYICSEVAVHSPNRRRTCPLLAVACDHCSTAPWGSSPPSASGKWVRVQGPWILLNFWTSGLIHPGSGAGW